MTRISFFLFVILCAVTTVNAQVYQVAFGIHEAGDPSATKRSMSTKSSKYQPALNAGGSLYKVFDNDGPADQVQLLGGCAVKKLPSWTVKFDATLSEPVTLEADKLVAVFPVTVPGSNKRNLLWPLEINLISLLTVEGDPLFEAQHNEIDFFDELTETNKIVDLTSDISYTGIMMRADDMDDVQVEKGPYEGDWLFDIMEYVTDQDVKDFLSYIAVRPMKYMGQSWKISEIFATWVVDGAPKPVVKITPTKEFKPGCDYLFLDLDEGTLNGKRPDASQAELKAQFTCFTGDSPENAGENFGGGVFDTDHEYYFYTGRDALNVRKGFKGDISLPVLGQTMPDAISILGEPASRGDYMLVYERKYGCLVLKTNGSVVTEVLLLPHSAAKYDPSDWE